MGLNLVLVDHHDTNVDLSRENIEVIKAKNLVDFYKKVRNYLEKDYDLIVSDEDPDGITSVIIYSLFKDKLVNFEGNRKGIKKEDLSSLKTKGVSTILAFDWFALCYSDLEIFDKIIYLNPKSSNLINVNTSEIIYRALPETEKLGRDISTIGTVCDYLVDTSKEKFKEFIEDYKELFPELLELARQNKLDRYNAYNVNGKNTKLYDLSLMFWAPFIIESDEGNKKLINSIIKEKKLDIKSLLDKNNSHYLINMYKELLSLITNEKNNFYSKSKIIDDKFYFYEPITHKNGFMSKFSSIITDELPKDKVIIMKSKSDNGKLKYSLRTRENKYQLGKILNSLGVGGGHDEAAGCIINQEKEEWFESELIKLINQKI